MKKISVYIFTYNQEDVIRRALDSVLCQKEWGLYRIVVSDDCSKDRTWEVLQEYKSKYPELVEPHRNDKNLGIYGNLQKAISYLPDSDLYCGFAGDDEYCDGFFQSVQELIKEKNIDTSEAVGIFSDWATVSPNGNRVVFKHNNVLSGCNLWSLKARGKITIRSLMWTKKVLDSYEPILEGCGLNLTESHFDAQSILPIKQAYYIPRVNSLYYTGVGVSKKLTDPKSPYNTTENIEKWNYAKAHYVHNKYDAHYAQFQIMRSEYYMTPKLCNLFILYYHYLRGQLPGCQDSCKAKVYNIVYLLKFRFCNIN